MAVAFTLASWPAPAPSDAPTLRSRAPFGGSSWASGSGVSGVSGVALLGFAAALGSVAKVTKVARRATPSTPATPSTSRREVLRLGGAGAASAVMPQVALAKTKQEAVDELKSYGMADIVPSEDPPSGWQWVVEGIGLTQDAYMNNQKFLTSEPTITRFLAPPFWNVATPRIDYNGASGTIQINNYGKGDSATIFIDTEFKGNLSDMKNADYKKTFYRALTLKGSGSLQGLSIGKVTDLEGAPGYKLVELTWTLFTGAGFEIDRDGFAVMTQLTPGGPLQILWGGVVSTRFKEMKDTLLQIVKSFRCAKVPQGIKIDMKKEYKDFSTNFREER